MRIARYAFVAILSMALVGVGGFADPAPVKGPTFVHLNSPRLACLGTQGDLKYCVQLGQGYFMDEPTYSILDAEMRRLQDAETRLKAENASLRASTAGWQPGWMTLMFAAAATATAAIYVEHKL